MRKSREKAERNKEEARQWAKAHGVKMRHDDGQRVSELMEIRDGRPIYYTTENRYAAISTATDLVRNTAPYNVDGSGITVGVWDAGSVLTNHQEMVGRVTLKNPGTGVNYHSTHVAGTIAAAGISVNAKGMAPSVNIDSHDWDSDISHMRAAAAWEPGQSGKIYLSNHSYGIRAGWYGNYFFGDWHAGVEPLFGQYDDSARLQDDVVYDYPYLLPFKSAGNDRTDNPVNGSTVYWWNGAWPWQSITYTNGVHAGGDGVYKGGYDTISTKGNAKNIMTVGAVDDAVSGSVRSLSHPYAQMAGFSSWGPSDDGRIKPDIVANGVGLTSCDDDHTADYTSLSGTSMSSPNACGSAALLIDYFDHLFPGDAMRASTLKGLIIHTADDLGRPGPDYSYGWGLMNTLEAAKLLKSYVDRPIRLTEETLNPGQASDTYTFFSDGIIPIRATLCWTDPPGAVAAAHDSRSPRLVNDLDVRITGPGGVTYWPYKLDYNNPTNVATTVSKNNIDNVEQVYIAAPTVGLYTVTVDYEGWMTNEQQWYSLLISGPDDDTDGDGMPDLWELAHFLNTTGGVASADSDGDGVDNHGEYVSGFDPKDSGSFFRVTGFSPPPAGSSPATLSWNTMEGRLYTVGYRNDLIISSFTAIPGAVDLPHTQNSYTDTIPRAGDTSFYCVDVRLQE